MRPCGSARTMGTESQLFYLTGHPDTRSTGRGAMEVPLAQKTKFSGESLNATNHFPTGEFCNPSTF